MGIDMILTLFLVKLGGGLLQARQQIQQIRKMRERQENPYVLPSVYQQYRRPADQYVA
ncbi:MAG: hypothetical protein AAF677_10720 [Pseudomonadota bacterium]